MNGLRLHNQWSRSTDGWLAGVCQGLGERFEINPGLVRLMWLASILFFGVGLFLYFLCAVVMPVKGNEASANQPKILGVCYRLSLKFDVDVVPLRIVTVLALMGSFGSVILLYLVLHFVLPSQAQLRD